MGYLPASWFHEVISRGSGCGGHMALNLWLAPPHSNATFQQPYIDNFWEDHYQSLRPARKLKRTSKKLCTKRKKPKRKRADTALVERTGVSTASASIVQE